MLITSGHSWQKNNAMTGTLYKGNMLLLDKGVIEAPYETKKGDFTLRLAQHNLAIRNVKFRSFKLLNHPSNSTKNKVRKHRILDIGRCHFYFIGPFILPRPRQK